MNAVQQHSVWRKKERSARDYNKRPIGKSTCARVQCSGIKKKGWQFHHIERRKSKIEGVHGVSVGRYSREGGRGAVQKARDCVGVEKIKRA